MQGGPQETAKPADFNGRVGPAVDFAAALFEDHDLICEKNIYLPEN
jgi:hypothetical protein